MDAEIGGFLAALGRMALASLGLLLVSVVLAVALRGRYRAGLMPGLRDVGGATFLPRVLSLIGQGARVPETLGTRRLRATLGLRLLYPAVLVLLVQTLIVMHEPLLSPGTALLALVVFLTIHAWAYEIRFDRETISLPRWSLGRRSFRWADLEAVTDRDPWFVTFHFRGGRRVSAHKYVVGYGLLMEAAQKALREV